ESKPAAKRPNIVFFFADDQTTSTLGCYGNEIVQTPTIDALARDGVRFNQALVSHSICWVSRTTILSGLTGRSYGTPGNRELARPEAVQTLYSDLLREAGYRTGYFGKWHAKMPKGYRREAHFDVFEAIGRNPYYKPQPDGTLRHETDLIVDRGIEFLKQQDPDQPFALNLWFNACHAEDADRRPGIGHFPWPRETDGIYDDVTIPPPPLNDPEIFAALPSFLRSTINRERFYWRWNTPEKYQTNIRAYYRMVTGIDRAIGRFRQALQAAGMADNTIIVYSADNGYYLGNRGLAGKWSHFEESLRVPLVVFDPRLPKSARGRVSDRIALNLDLPATFLDWAGVPIPDRYQGKSLRRIVNNEPVDDWRSESFHEHFAVRSRIPAFEGIRDARYKYVRYVDDGPTEFLHDRQTDPNELVNLASAPEYGKVLADMRKRTDASVAKYGGPLHDPPPLSRQVPADPIASADVGTTKNSDGQIDVLKGGFRQWSGDRKLWSFRNGILTGTADGTLQKNRFITWKPSTIRNFEIRVQVRVSKGGNSGIQYRGKSRPDLGLDVVSGYQCDVVANVPGFNGMLYEEKGRRILARTGQKVVIDPHGQAWITESLPKRQFEPGTWHDFRIRVEGNHHWHWINDHLTAEVIDLDVKNRSLEGVLAVQVHVGPKMKIEYKNFRLKNLPDDMPILAPEDVAIPAGSLGVRPQGKLPIDWKPPVYDVR
ncbi:MAG: sulfatase-like hydrolase/transferase, partial [Planctomycetota bacterium]